LQDGLELIYLTGLSVSIRKAGFSMTRKIGVGAIFFVDAVNQTPGIERIQVFSTTQPVGR
jgi:hypothetical protein